MLYTTLVSFTCARASTLWLCARLADPMFLFCSTGRSSTAARCWALAARGVAQGRRHASHPAISAYMRYTAVLELRRYEGKLPPPSLHFALARSLTTLSVSLAVREKKRDSLSHSCSWKSIDQASKGAADLLLQRGEADVGGTIRGLGDVGWRKYKAGPQIVPNSRLQT